jgi:hypothetical protein
VHCPAGDPVEQRLRGFSMVVRPGQEKAPAGMPSKPRIETSRGHSRPASRTAMMAPSAIRSLAANTAMWPSFCRSISRCIAA